jgi:hypothetical protein
MLSEFSMRHLRTSVSYFLNPAFRACPVAPFLAKNIEKLTVILRYVYRKGLREIQATAGNRIYGLARKNALLPEMLSLWRANKILPTCFVNMSEAFSLEEHVSNTMRLCSVQSCNVKSCIAMCHIYLVGADSCLCVIVFLLWSDIFITFL